MYIVLNMPSKTHSEDKFILRANSQNKRYLIFSKEIPTSKTVNDYDTVN